MAAYLQQGDRSWGLLEDPEIGGYAGLIVSPVNDGPDAVRSGLARLKEQRDNLEVVLDPQLYNPSSEKGRLSEWPYYPADFETSDHGDPNWWVARGRGVVDAASELGIDAVCTPALFPRNFSDDYYRLVVDVADATYAYAATQGIDTLVTAIICLRDLGDPLRANQIASILSATDCERVYLTFLADDIEPRQPLQDPAALATAVHLVRLLSSQLRVHVAFCSHDMVMWKFAGASDVSSGKFFNLRRFSPRRWKEDDGAGRQVEYWNESTLGTVMREQDLARLVRDKWFEGRTFDRNPHSQRIIEMLGSGTAWFKHSWLQYLRWVANAERDWEAPANAEEALEMWDKNWEKIERMRVLFTDRRNDGSHVRAWLNAIREGGAR